MLNTIIRNIYRKAAPKLIRTRFNLSLVQKIPLLHDSYKFTFKYEKQFLRSTLKGVPLNDPVWQIKLW